MTICAVFDGRRIEDCTRGDGDCLCAKERAISAALSIAIKEAGFARLAYDQLVARQDQEKERLLERICAAIESCSLNGYSESTVRHFREIVICAFKGTQNAR